MLNPVFNNISVLGAGGKMGSGISILILSEMARIEAEQTKDIGGGSFRLHLIDSNDATLYNFAKTIKGHLTKYAERNINALRRYFMAKPFLVSNLEVINYFVEGALRIVHLESDWHSAKDSQIIFEAIIENIEIKTEIFSELGQLVGPETVFFTNTSSIPIHLLNEKAKLQNRIIGFHFYNPPVIQKLVELIIPSETDPRIQSIAYAWVKKLDKMAVFSSDVAGFIGNGHFIREALYALEKMKELTAIYSLHQAILMINKVTEEFLIRPMGIFQLIDYVGIDVFHHISEVMSNYIPHEHFQSVLIEEMIKLNILGGQNSDGSRKNGFFQYEKHFIVGVYSIDKKTYISLNEEDLMKTCEEKLGKVPDTHFSWKKLQKDPKALEKIKIYLLELNQEESLGSKLAKDYFKHSKAIAKKLVDDNVASNLEDVDKILKNGFFHLYGFNDIDSIT